MARDTIRKEDISDTLIERPISFSVKGKQLNIYRPTLGKIQLLSRLYEAIGLNGLKGTEDIYYFCYIKAQSHRDECLRILAYSTLPGDSCLLEANVKERLNNLKSLGVEDVSTLLFTILTLDNTEDIKRHFGMDYEAKRLAKVSKVKQSSAKGSFSFGGKSVWGNFIDAACERYGWSYQYVLWGISYANLQLLLADQVRTVFLTDEERKRAGVSSDNIVVKADDAKAMEQLIKLQSWR